MRLLYNLGIFMMGLGLKLISPFHEKSRLWVQGRKNWRKNLEQGMDGLHEVIWIHCSSLGEFEQGRPIIEALKDRGEKIVVSFFSPSGYENLQNYKYADFVTYLPLDTQQNARDFLCIVNPKAMIFIKYEFWFNFIREGRRIKIPIFLVSGIFRSDQHFFKIWGGWFRKHLRMYKHFFVQNQQSIDLLKKIGIDNAEISGDSRFDRVIKISRSPKELKEVSDLISSRKVLVAGSTWHPDEELLSKLSQELKDVFFIIAPHLVDETHIRELLRIFGKETLLYSKLTEGELKSGKVLIIDKIGLLSSLYRFADLVYIGGGFGKGIHNSLEAAVYGKVLMFGPEFKKFNEAIQMVNEGTAFVINNEEELTAKSTWLLNNDEERKLLEDKNRKFVIENAGATEKVMDKFSDLGII